MLSTYKSEVKLPAELKKYFWDVDFEALSFKEYPKFITERIMDYGDLYGIKWLLSQTDKEYLISVIESSRNLNAKTRNFWKTMFIQPSPLPSENA